MVVPLVAKGLLDGISGLPYVYTILKTIPWIALIVLLKVYFGGAKNRSERVMHGKVIMVTVRIGIRLTFVAFRLTNARREAHQVSEPLSCKRSPLEELRLFS
jgi:small-conductance mechanosensitive channel